MLLALQLKCQYLLAATAHVAAMAHARGRGKGGGRRRARVTGYR
jgi:hypothetical protein